MHSENSDNGAVQLPRPTVWPMVLALGISLVMAGMVTSVVVGLLGGLLAVVSCVGWFRQVLPHEAHEGVPISDEVVAIESKRTLLRHAAGLLEPVLAGARLVTLALRPPAGAVLGLVPAGAVADDVIFFDGGALRHIALDEGEGERRGVANIGSLPLAGTQDIFGFDGDGLCTWAANGISPACISAPWA